MPAAEVAGRPSRSMRFDDAINGLLAIAAGGLLIWWSQGFAPVRHIDYGPGFFPTLIGLGMIGAGGVIIVGRVLSRAAGAGGVDDTAPRDDRTKGPVSVLTLFLFLAAVLAYVLLVEWLGFLLTLPPILFVLLAWLGNGILRSLAIALVATLALQLFFQQLMLVPLPWGLLEPYAGVLTL